MWVISPANRKCGREKARNDRQHRQRRLNSSQTENGTIRSKLGLAARAALLGALFFIEKIFLTRFVNVARADAALGIGGALRQVQHYGFRFIVAFAAAMTLFTFAGGERWKSLMRMAPVAGYLAPIWALAHLVLIACLAWLGTMLFPTTPASLPFAAVVGLWMICGAAAIFSAFAALGPPRLWQQAARSLGSIWVLSAAAALAAAMAIPVSERFWSTATAATFRLVSFILQPMLPDLSVDPAARVMGTQHFAVKILDYCSGVEGMTLILCFTVAWLWFFRREYRFPRALWLIPLGMALMFALNAVRLAVLVLIGDAGHPEIAEYGFHSQAGWIAFNAVAVGIAVWTRHSRWLNRRVEPLRDVQTDNPTSVFLMPLLAIIAAGMLSHALSGRFEWLYPLRLIACVTVLVIYRRRIAALEWRWSWRGPLLGVAVFFVWTAAVHFLVPDAQMPGALAAAPPSLRWGWIISRVAGAVLMVPLAEELAYRGFLMRRFQSRDFDTLAYGRVSLLSLALSAAIFGAAHGGLWLPGIIAGLAYGWIVKRQGQLGEAVVAHMTTNLLVAGFALVSGNWAAF